MDAVGADRYVAVDRIPKAKAIDRDDDPLETFTIFGGDAVEELLFEVGVALFAVFRDVSIEIGLGLRDSAILSREEGLDALVIERKELRFRGWVFGVDEPCCCEQLSDLIELDGLLLGFSQGCCEQGKDQAAAEAKNEDKSECLGLCSLSYGVGTYRLRR